MTVFAEIQHRCLLLEPLGWGGSFSTVSNLLVKKRKKKKSKLSSPVLPGIHFLLGGGGPSPGLCSSVNTVKPAPSLAAGS